MTTSEIAAMYESGKTSRQIAEVCGLSFRTVLRRLHEAGVMLRNPGAPAIEKLRDADWIKGKYASGLSTTQLAGELGCTASRVSFWLRQAGAEMRETGAEKGHSRNTAEARRKMSESHKGRFLGEQNPNWKGGHALDPERNRYEAKKWSRLVRERDGWKCAECGAAQKLHAHHLKRWKLFPELRYDVANGITLCHDCHQKAHGFTFPWTFQKVESSKSARPQLITG